MNQEKRLFQQYVNGWKENDSHKIIDSLSENCIIIESHGPTYRGIEQVRKWVEFWVKKRGRVIRWDIVSFVFHRKQKTAFVEWNFACNVNRKNYELLGISVVKFSDGKISYIHEYRMTKSPYNWKARQLNPE